MLLIYQPTGGERHEWTFRPAELDSESQAEAIEDATGWDFEEFGRRFMNGSAKARRAAVWVMLRAERPRLRFNEVRLRMDEVFVGWEPDEAARIRAALADPDIEVSDSQREALLDELDSESPAVVPDVPDAAVPESAQTGTPEGKDTAGADESASGT